MHRVLEGIPYSVSAENSDQYVYMGLGGLHAQLPSPLPCMFITLL